MKAQNETKHNDKCVMAFGKYSPIGDCPRCDELRNGAAPRKGWFRKVEPVRPHDCKLSRCGPICTHGD